MNRRMIAFGGMAAVGLGMIVGTADAEDVTFTTDQGFRASVPAGTMERCLEDDGTGAPCVYVADEQGNGEGTSFVVLGGPSEVSADLTHDEARKLSK